MIRFTSWTRVAWTLLGFGISAWPAKMPPKEAQHPLGVLTEEIVAIETVKIAFNPKHLTFRRRCGDKVYQITSVCQRILTHSGVGQGNLQVPNLAQPAQSGD